MRLPPLLFVLSMASFAVAQQGPPTWLGADIRHGFLWPHRPSMRGMVEGPASALVITAQRQLSGTRDWHLLYRGVRMGGQLGVYTVGNDRLTGRLWQLVPHLQLPLIHGDRGALSLRLGWGLGWAERTFQRTDNPRHIAIATRLNTAIHLLLSWDVEVGRWHYGLGLGLDHWSNGAVREPNLGLNVVTARLGVARALGEPWRPAAPAEPPPAVGVPVEHMVIGAVGADEKGLPGNGTFMAVSLSALRQWRVSRRSFVAAGLDLFNKGSLHIFNPMLEERSPLARTQGGLSATYALGFGRADLFLATGFYVLAPVPDQAPIYSRIGVRHRTGRHLVWNLSLKTHYAVADHWEAGIGYRW